MVGRLAFWDTSWVFLLTKRLEIEVFAVLPYRRHVTSIALLTDAERIAFADMISQITTRYDNLFQCPFAYSMGIHQRPVPQPDSSSDNDSVAHLHIHFDPPLLRSATVKKFLVGCVAIEDILLLLTRVWIALSSWQKLNETLRLSRQQKGYEIVHLLTISNWMPSASV